MAEILMPDNVAARPTEPRAIPHSAHRRRRDWLRRCSVEQPNNEQSIRRDNRDNGSCHVLDNSRIRRE